MPLLKSSNPVGASDCCATAPTSAVRAAAVSAVRMACLMIIVAPNITGSARPSEVSRPCRAEEAQHAGLVQLGRHAIGGVVAGTGDDEQILGGARRGGVHAARVARGGEGILCSRDEQH